MRCIICNDILSEAELKFKVPSTGNYTDECFECYEQCQIDLQELIYNIHEEDEDDLS
jgi:hypothetical protein